MGNMKNIIFVLLILPFGLKAQTVKDTVGVNCNPCDIEDTSQRHGEWHLLSMDSIYSHSNFQANFSRTGKDLTRVLFIDENGVIYYDPRYLKPCKHKSKYGLCKFVMPKPKPITHVTE